MSNSIAIIVAAVMSLSAIAGAADKAYRFAYPSQRTTFDINIADNLAYIPVQIGGEKLSFVLDSGSSRMLIDKAKAIALGMKLTDADSVQGAGAGRIPLQKVEADVLLQLPGLESRHITFFAADLKGVSEATGHRLDGIIGYDFLSRFAVMLDYANKRLSVFAPEAFTADSRDESMPVVFKGNWPMVRADMKVAEGVTIQDKFLVDSGSSDAVDHPIANNMQHARQITTGVGLGTAGTGRIAVLPELNIGRFSVTDVSIACCGATEATSRLIGGGILHRFTVTFDYPRHRDRKSVV